MKIEEFRSILHEDMKLAAKANDNSESNEFLLYATDVLMKAEEFDDFIECNYEGISRRKGNMCINGYALDDTDESCSVFIVDYHGPDGSESVKKDDIDSLFKKIRLFVEEAIKYELYCEISATQQVIDFARDLFFDNEIITKYRFYLLTDAFNKQRVKTIKDTKIQNKAVELNVWDINRLYDLVASQTQKESVEIVLSDFGYEGIPCVKAVECKDAVADIDVSPEDDDKSNLVTYSSYLAVVPGSILNELYLEYGSRLLEGNVRSFLSAKRKVNKNIQNTIKNYPEMFFAYNNGIAATATEVDTKMTLNGPVITRIKDLQIVNGGQTTASIANTLLSAKKNETIDITALYVPMKLSVLEHSVAEKIIPKISEYSNSQNKVDASDFFSNHPFHIRMEDLSRKTSIPSNGGNQYQQYWFYERAKGQYNQGMMKLKGAELKAYKERYPTKQVLTKLDVAKYMELYHGHPDIVSRGNQKALKHFADEIKSKWEKSDLQFNLYYYKRMVALAILYKSTDDLIKQADWYKEKKSYKGNVIAYSISILFNNIHKVHGKYELDFLRIWNEQAIYEELEDQIKVLAYDVYAFITGPREIENVTEWCKKEACWSRAKDMVWTINEVFLSTLVSADSLKEKEKETKVTQKVQNEIDSFNSIFNRGEDYWAKVLDWGQSRKLLNDKEISILRLIINMRITGRIPTDKQIKVVMNARQRLVEEGMPLQF